MKLTDSEIALLKTLVCEKAHAKVMALANLEDRINEVTESDDDAELQQVLAAHTRITEERDDLLDLLEKFKK